MLASNSEISSLLLQKSFTLWFTGLPSSGKTTLGFAVVERLKKLSLNPVLLDGDALRKGLNGDLGFSPRSRHENIRRTAEVAKLFASNGSIPVVTLISPYKKDRETAKVIHQSLEIPFFEIYLKTPLDVCEGRDVKGLYKLARQDIIKDMTGIQSPYEVPECPDMSMDTNVLSIDECVGKIMKFIDNHLNGAGCNWNHQPGLPDLIPELFVEQADDDGPINNNLIYRIELSIVDMQWLQVLAEGWAYPLKGFMNETQYLQCLHFSMINDSNTSTWHIMPLPIVLAIDQVKKAEIEEYRTTCVNLVYEEQSVALLNNLTIFPHRKEERVARKFTTASKKHPVIKMILESGDYLIGGDVSVYRRIIWNDGLDSYRLTPNEIRRKVKEGRNDAVFAFQLRNPIHNGHALLIKNTHSMLVNKGYLAPLLLLHPLGGYTKHDDLPLYHRIKQHEALFEENVLDAKNTLLAIFPSPMSYAGPTEVLWHCRARMICGATHYIVGRDPAGLPHPEQHGQDLFEPSHGAKILVNAPHLENLNIIPFTVVAYNKLKKKMELYNSSRKEEYEFISGTKMRSIAREGGQPPEGFMASKAWNVVANYYQNQNE